MHGAALRRTGNDITIIAWHRMVNIALQAAEELANKGTDAEVIDLRSLRPIDLPSLQKSVEKTGAAVIVEEDCKFAGAGAEIAAILNEVAFADLKIPVQRIAAADVPTPYNRELELRSIPDAASVVARIQEMHINKTE